MDQPGLQLEDFTTNFPGVYNQGARMAGCVASAITMAACYVWHKKSGGEYDYITGAGGKMLNPSNWWIWYHARRLIGTEHENVGCNVRNAFRAVDQFGCPPDFVWPHSPLTTGDDPGVAPDDLRKALSKNTGTDMYKIAKQHFVNEFECYSIEEIGLEPSWTWGNGKIDHPPEASDRII